jgi:beta-galactosidase
VRAQLHVHNFAQTDTVKIAHDILSPAGEVVARGQVQRLIGAGQAALVEATLTVMNPERWDIEHPALYTLVSTVTVGGKLSDRYETPFGVRSLRFDPDHGFFLNDRRVPLKGVNLHHDHGPLGAAFYPRAMERQLEIMQAMGVNAIRNSHNCDRMGILVFNEIFDKYDRKADILPDTDFDAFAQRNVRNFVVRDRNHPSVFLWSVGNEIGDVQWNEQNGFHRLHTMLNYVNKYDPTRPTTLVNDQWESAKLRHFDRYDVHAYNYGRRYRLARQMEPNKSVIISESASTLSTRGFYEFPLPTDKTEVTSSLQVSSYDLHAPWWAEIADDDFMWQQNEDYIAGEFVWTGFDYLGEPTPYTNDAVREMGMSDRDASRSSYFGAVDLVGLPKDRFYLYQSYWRPEDTTIHLLPHWNWPERVGQTVPVFVYTNGDCAELFLNGVSQGMRCKQPKSDSSTLRFRLMWPEVTYQPGTLEVVAYRAGKVLGQRQVQTAGEPAQLRLTVDRSSIAADGMDLAYVRMEMLDAEGNLVPWADHLVKLSLSGPGLLAGVGNGNPQSMHPFQAKEVPLFYGQAVAILRAGTEAGRLELQAEVKGLPTARVIVTLGQ